MSDVPPAAASGPRFEPPAAGAPGGISGPRGGERRPRGPSENEDAARGTELADRPAESSEPSASQCGSQIRSPVSVGVTEDSKEEGCTLEDQEAAELEEKLPDQTQPTKEEAVVRMTNYHIHQGGGDIVMIQSDHTGAVDILSAELETADLLGEQRKAQPPPLAPPTTWTMGKMKEFKTKMGKEKNARMVVKRGEVVTVRVPTHPDGKRLCWEFATDDYDIGFGVYFDWTTVTSTAITVQVSESSDEEDEEEEEEIEGLTPVGDVERGSKSYLRNRYGEIMPVYRRDSHREVQAGSHDYPEHLGDQEGVREKFTVEQPELGAQENGNQKTGWITITFRVSRQGAELIRVSSRAAVTLGPVMEGKAVTFLKGEREPGKRGTAKLHYSSRGKHRTILQGGRTVGFCMCQSKVIFHLAAWGGLFLPLAPLGETKDHATAFVQHLNQA